MTCKTLTPAMRKARTIRHTASAAFYIGAVASLAANVAASQHTFVGVATGLWSPLALLLSLELLERVPAKGKAGVVRKVAVVFLAAIAAWTSYWHLVHIFEDADLDVVSVYLMPLTVDVLMAIGRASMKPLPASVPRRAAAKKAAVTTGRKLKAV